MNKRITTACVATCVWVNVALLGSVFADTKVVDPSGHGDYTTIQAAVNDLPNPGPRTIIVRAGTYHEAVLLSARNPQATNDSQRIVIMADTNTAPGSVTVTPPSGSSGVYLTQSRFITLQGLVITGVRGKNVAVRLGGGSQDNEDIAIVGCQIHHNASHGIQVDRGNPRTWIMNSLIRDNGSINKSGHGVTIANGVGATVYLVNNTIVRNQFDGVFVDVPRPLRLVNNLIVSNGRYGFQRASGSSDPAAMTLLYNMFYANTAGDTALASKTLDATDNGNRTTAGNESAGVVGCTFPNCGHTASLTELFVNPGAVGTDFHLAAGSPAIDRGVNIFSDGATTWAIVEDLEGNPRPQDGDGDCFAIADAGCYEAPSIPCQVDTVPPLARLLLGDGSGLISNVNANTFGGIGPAGYTTIWALETARQNAIATNKVAAASFADTAGNALNLGNIPPGGYVQTGDTRVVHAITALYATGSGSVTVNGNAGTIDFGSGGGGGADGRWLLNGGTMLTNDELEVVTAGGLTGVLSNYGNRVQLTLSNTTSAGTVTFAEDSGYATNAGAATSAATAAFATSSGYATNAGNATFATTAGTAGSATSAGTATFATSAGSAGSAAFATSSGYATNAGAATSAGTATFATSAGYATNAGTAASATTAGTATFAVSSGYATNAGSAPAQPLSNVLAVGNISGTGIVMTAKDATTSHGFFFVDGSGLTNQLFGSGSNMVHIAPSGATSEVWDTINLPSPANTNGNYLGMSVGTATFAAGAGTATFAASSGYATNAGSATSATTADTATFAVSSGYATNAGNASFATTAATAGSATSAGTATFATSAGSADSAAFATSSGYATNAGAATSAGTATFATSSGYATNAGTAASATTADTATFAISSGFATNAGGAVTATFAVSSGYATNAGSAPAQSLSNVLAVGNTSGTGILMTAKDATTSHGFFFVDGGGNTNQFLGSISNLVHIVPAGQTNIVWDSGNLPAPVVTNGSYPGMTVGTATFAAGAGTATFADSTATSTNALQLGGIVAAGYSTTNQLTATSNTLAGATALKLDITGTNTLASTALLNSTSNTLAAATLAVTNGLPTTTITNGLETIAAADALTNGLVGASVTNGLATPSVTNGLETVAAANTLSNTLAAATESARTNAIATNKVANATYADSAGTAGSATTAATATFAVNSGYATNAGTATFATTAGTTAFSTSAGYATNAGTATFAAEAGTATFAVSSGYATNAGSAPAQSLSNVLAVGNISGTGIVMTAKDATTSHGFLFVDGGGNTNQFLGSISNLVHIVPAGQTNIVWDSGNLPAPVVTNGSYPGMTVGTATFAAGAGSATFADSAGTSTNALHLGGIVAADYSTTNQLTATSNTLAGATALKLDITGTNTLASTALLNGTSNTLAAATVAITNGLPTTAITNGLETIAAADALTNSLVGASVTNGLAMPSVTNGLETIAAANTLSNTLAAATESARINAIATNKVAAATFADSGNYATNAATAAFATTAGTAGSASSAGTATFATSSGYATNAGSASTAGTATFAISSGFATNAGSAGTATFAISSGYATNAGAAPVPALSNVLAVGNTSGTGIVMSAKDSTSSHGFFFVDGSGLTNQFLGSGSNVVHIVPAGQTNIVWDSGNLPAPLVTNGSYPGMTVGTATFAAGAGSATFADSAGTSTNALQLGGVAAASYSTTNLLTATSNTLAGATALKLDITGTNTLAPMALVSGTSNTLAGATLAITNGLPTAAITNGLETITAAGALTNGFVMGSITNGLALPSVTNGLPTTAITNGLETITAAGALASTNLLTSTSNTLAAATLAVTNGLPTTAITNGLETIAAAGALTNGLVGTSVTNGLVTPSVTNGLETIAAADTLSNTLAAATESARINAIATNKVAAATFADSGNYATNSGNAAFATTAGTAGSATSAGTATFATSSGYSTNAGAAASAGTATFALSSSYATNAGSAASATTADTATFAISSGFATNAGGAVTATFAVSSGYATNAGSAPAPSLSNVLAVGNTSGTGILMTAKDATTSHGFFFVDGGGNTNEFLGSSSNLVHIVPAGPTNIIWDSGNLPTPAAADGSYTNMNVGTATFASGAGTATFANGAATSTNALELGGVAAAGYSTTNLLVATSNTLAGATALKLDITGTNTLASTALVTGTSNTLAAATLAVTNGLPTTAITNGLETAVAAGVLTNGFVSASVTNGLATPSVTNGLETIAAANTLSNTLAAATESARTNAIATNKVATATFADSGNYATNAGTATFATTAGTAAFSTSAGYATNAGTASFAASIPAIATNTTLVTTNVIAVSQLGGTNWYFNVVTNELQLWYSGEMVYHWYHN